MAAVITITLVMAVLLWGCGGSSSSDTTTTTSSLSPAGGDISSALSSGAAKSTTTPKSLTAIDKLVIPATAQDIPQDFKAAYGQAKPIVILFYVPGQPDDSRVLTSLQALKGSFPNCSFFFYNYNDPTSYGSLPTFPDLKVQYTPQMFLIAGDKSGTALTGYWDEGSLNQLLVNLGG